MNKYKITIINELIYLWWNIKANWIYNSLLFLTSGFFLSLMLIGKKNVDNQVTDFYSSEGLMVGYLTWLFLYQAIGISQDIKGWSVYEQLDLSILGINWILIIRSCYSTFYSFINLFSIIFLLKNIFSLNIKVNMLYTFTWLFIGLFPLYFLGLTISYLTVLFQDRKILSHVMGLSFFIFPVLLFLTAYPFNSFSLIPYLSSATTIKLYVTENLIFPIWWYLFILVQSIVYTLSFYSIAIFAQQKYKRR